ncbi:Protein of unknown function DUF544 [Macleaya cordata]|uniref:MINDY deubiquitinase domain-containing protein n=1 Tax=Macleaya cordata TaxID=56857 RepID=A0A200QKR0_MACCD|nr:Protein of unknown function DUF544 [Macleaya cordata]
MATEEGKQEEKPEDYERVYKTKIIDFLGRTTPIILQNDNGPCPLLAICNVLLLKNSLNLSLDISEVSLQKLLSLVAERLIDSNSNIENKDAGYVENQQQNIADAIDLLPRLATGIDVNIQFRRIDDFEFTRECAIFDLLDIPLYHGWIVDPQDYDTANAISSKSYNTLMGELVALDTRSTEGKHMNIPEEDCIDFAAATTATLGVPSPCLSRGRSFDESLCSISDHQKGRKGDLEEEAELLRALELSSAKSATSMEESLLPETSSSDASVHSDECKHVKNSGSDVLAGAMEGHLGDEHQSHLPELSVSQDSNASSSCNNGSLCLENESRETDPLFLKNAAQHQVDQLIFKEPAESLISNNLMENIANDTLVQNQSEPLRSLDGDSSSAYKDPTHESGGGQEQICLQDTSTSSVHLDRADHHSICDATVVCGPSATASVTSSIDDSEPIYEGEDCILDSGLTPDENQEPMYEGEVVLAEQAERGKGDACDIHSTDEITQQKGVMIRNFLNNSASQLTIYGLFCLQEGLKERELCVFFRNNHFNTMFKFNGELNILATDQGYISQPDLVWEKLNEVNGDTVFMTGNFKEFKVENQLNDTWDEHNAMASTNDYLASIESSEPAGSTLSSDLQLAIALQQQEFENQPQRQHTSQQSVASGNSRLVTGPQNR